MTQVNVGDHLDVRELRTIHGKPVRVPDPELVVHLQFRRYAGCPVCNLHLRSITQRHDDIRAAGIREIVVFHSTAETMLEFQGQLPFAAVADPGKLLYTEFGVGQLSPLAALNPRSWLIAGRALTSAPSLRGAMGWGEKKMGLPAEFLIATDGTVLAAKYGQHLDDHWQVDDLLTLSRSVVPSADGG